ncbi:MAG: helix-turn-helix transcriptional regulator [Deltaproteobacteria bacterium]|nr:helix-turn-helix transcriptional regulator [Deltaproteobacteria bacterium]
MANQDFLTSCLPKPSLRERELLTPEQAGELQGVFKTLANDTRLRILHALVRAGEVCVSEMSDLLAMKPQAISNQLIRLADRGIVGSRRNGNNIYYRLVDPCVIQLLDHGLCLSEDAKTRSK